jgi:hypothetical protein
VGNSSASKVASTPTSAPSPRDIDIFTAIVKDQ